MTKSIDRNRLGTNSTAYLVERWGETYDLAANTEYFLAVKPTSVTNIALADFDVPSAAIMDCLSGGQAFYFAGRTDAGAWTVTTTKRPQMGLILHGLSDGKAAKANYLMGF